jgi:hypothetical protein
MVKDSGVAVRPDSLAVEFDDERLVANAGVVLTSTLINRLGLALPTELPARCPRRDSNPCYSLERAVT